MSKPRIAVFSGPRSTIANTPTLVTSNKGRRPGEQHLEGRFDHLQPQRLYEPVIVRIAKFSAHPLEEDASEVYHADGKEYYEVELRPEDGAYLLPYMARRNDGTPDGRPFEEADLRDPAIAYGGRQSFFPDGSGLFEEIDRGLSGRGDDGAASELDKLADYDFVRVLPPAGYTKQNETAGRDFFPYSPRPLGRFLLNGAMARAANIVQATIDSGRYDGFIWLEGKPSSGGDALLAQPRLGHAPALRGHIVAARPRNAVQRWRPEYRRRRSLHHVRPWQRPWGRRHRG